MKYLIVFFDNNDRNNEADLFVTQEHSNGDTTILKHVIDEQARTLYKLLTDESIKAAIKDKSCSNCKYWLLDKNDETRRCSYCFEMDEWVKESEVDK